MKNLVLVLLLAGVAFGQNYPTYVRKPKPKTATPVRQPDVPAGTVYQEGTEVYKSTGNGGRMNVTDRLPRNPNGPAPSPYTNTGSKVYSPNSALKTSRLNKDSYPGQLP